MQLAGLYRVNREALAELPADALRTLVKGDAMDAIFEHLWSLANFQRMLSRRSIIDPSVGATASSRLN